MLLYKNDKGDTLIARDKNQGSAFEKSGFKFVSECDEKGKPIKEDKKEDSK